MMDINEIREILPHRYPFLLVDRVTEVVEGKSIKGYKNVTINDQFFQGHFPAFLEIIVYTVFLLTVFNMT